MPAGVWPRIRRPTLTPWADPGAGPGIRSPPAGRRWAAANTRDGDGDEATTSQLHVVMSAVKPWEAFPIPAEWQLGDSSRQHRAALVCPRAWEARLDRLCFPVPIWAAYTGQSEEAPSTFAASQVSESYLAFSLAVWMGAGRLKTITGWLLLVWDPCTEAAWWGVCPVPGHGELCRRSGGVRGCRGTRPRGTEGPEPWMFVLHVVLGAGASTWGRGSGGCQPCQWVTSGLWGPLGTATD